MHLTKTLDYAVLLHGHLTMVMEDDEIELAPGDIVVQQAAVHAWKNNKIETAVMFVVMLGLPDTDTGRLEEPEHG